MTPGTRHAIVVADGDVGGSLLRDLARPDETGTAPLLVAADGGAGRALKAGLRPDLVVGDGDSMQSRDRARLAEIGVPLELAATDKDESDTELCLLAARAAGCTCITIVGALGGARPEHAIANVLLLGHPLLDDMDARIVTETSTLRRIGTRGGAGSLELRGRPGDFVSLFAMADHVDGVRTEGLRFVLDGESLALGPSRGLSNEMVDPLARVSSDRGRLLIVHTAHTTGGG